MTRRLIKLGVTIGDPAGIGPEVMAGAVRKNAGLADFVIYGPKASMSRFPNTCEFRVIRTDGVIRTGKYSMASGLASIRALKTATDDLALGHIQGLVTGPIDKRAFKEADLDFPGQTEMVAKALRTKDFAMNLSGPRLRVSLVTTHLSLRDVADAITMQKIVSVIGLTNDFLKKALGKARPSIGVLGLNPHASDHGRFGSEEAVFIEPAVFHAKNVNNIDVSGPLPADTAFSRAVNGEFDGLVAMYHDQGLGPLKLMHFNDAVNITLGLPRPRTSPDHGPAFDIAGKGRANPTSAFEAIRWAVRLAI